MRQEDRYPLIPILMKGPINGKQTSFLQDNHSLLDLVRATATGTGTPSCPMQAQRLGSENQIMKYEIMGTAGTVPNYQRVGGWVGKSNVLLQVP